MMQSNGGVKVLMTGFEPFGGSNVNPSAVLAEMLDGERVGEVRVAASVLPVGEESGPRALEAAIERHTPDVVLSLGLAGGRAALSIERAALNVLDFPIPDN